MTFWRHLVWLLVLLLGVVLSPLRAVAATVPTVIAYDVAVRPAATVQVEVRPSLRPDAEKARTTVCGDALSGTTHR